jgi:hypothetical protein
VIVRWATDCQAVASAYSPTVGAEHASAKLTRPKHWAFWFYRCVFCPTVFGLLRSPKTQPPSGRLSTLRLPTRFGVQFKLFRFYDTQRRVGRPRSSPRRFAAIVCLSADGRCFGFGGAFWCTFWLLPFQGESYWGRFFTGRCPVLWAFCPVGACWFCQHVLAPPLSACADVTARRSVTHLTFTNTSWCSVQTFLILLRTEAGETPAFPSFAASRHKKTRPNGAKSP